MSLSDCYIFVMTTSSATDTASSNTDATPAYEYCKSHLGAHSTGWCTVRDDRRVPLTATTGKAALDEVRSHGWPIYQEGNRRTWSMDGTTIVDSGDGRW